jgi:hypothetical protein
MNTNVIDQAQAILNNKAVMQFLRSEALAKVAADMNAAGSSITAKGVELMSFNKLGVNNKKICERIDQYIAAGVVGCLMAVKGV